MTQRTIDEKLNDIFEIIKAIEIEDDPGVSTVMLDCFILGLNVIKELSENPTDTRDKFDVSQHVEMVSRILGIPLKDLVMQCIDEVNTALGNSDKPVDQNTLDFITSQSDLDDYDKFLAQNKAKEDLDFLSKAI